MGSQAQLSQQHRSQTPRLQNFNIPKRPGHQPTYPTEQQLRGVNYNRGSASSRRPTGEANAIGNSRKKRQRHRHAHDWQQLTRARFPGGQFPAKFGC